MPTPTESPRPPGALPTFLVIGAQKAGTTALHQYLRVHEDTCMSTPKELKFFSSDENWQRGIDWYAGHFASAAPGQAVGESSPDYARCTFIPGVPERIASVIPDVKLIYLVRDPLERIRSAYQHAVSHGVERRSFEEVVRTVAWYLDDTRYSMQIDRFLAVFPADQLLVLSNRALRERRVETLGQVAEFIGIRPDRFPPRQIQRDVYTSESRKAPGRAVVAASRGRSADVVRRIVPPSIRRRIRAGSERPFDPETLRLSPETVRWVKAELAEDHRRLVDRLPEVEAWL